jgi:DNA-binding IclR family transcriptional regulator
MSDVKGPEDAGMPPVEPDYIVRSVLRAAKLLRLVHEEGGDATLVRLSKESGLSKPTVFRLMRTLIEAELVEVHADNGHFRLGPLCVALGQTYLENVDVLRDARPVLSELRDATSETVHLGILDNSQRVLYLEKLAGTHAIGVMKSRVGATVPAHCTGIGKALLAAAHALPPADTLTQFTPATITNLDDLSEELELIRSRGYSLDLQEHEVGVCCVAVPILDDVGKPVAALSVSGPATRISLEDLEDGLLQQALEAASAISTRLGWRAK